MNPFLGEGDAQDFEEGNVEVSWKNSTPVELTDTFDTIAFPVRKKETVINPVLVLLGDEPPKHILDLPEDALFYVDFRKKWQNQRDLSKKKLEQLANKPIAVPKESEEGFISALDSDTKMFSDLFLNLSHVFPAFESSLENTRQILELITDSEISSTQSGFLRAMLTDIINARIMSVMFDKFEITDRLRELISKKFFEGAKK